jgi:rubrerythrin
LRARAVRGHNEKKMGAFMKPLKGTKTEGNLRAAFAGESMARNKYSFYASKARKEGYEQIAALFLAAADNEREHAKIWYALLEGGEIHTTLGNLTDAADGERGEWSAMYPEFAEVAREEGFEELAVLFEQVARIEQHHEGHFLSHINNLEKNQVFEKEGKVHWHCRNCGYIHYAATAPAACPVCEHPQGYFETNETVEP